MKNTKRGFTIVELVIVIAVIAILAAILIPVFADVTKSANETSLKANIKNAHSAHVAAKAEAHEDYLEIDGYVYVNDGEAYNSDGSEATFDTTGKTAAGTYGDWTLYVK